MRKKIDINGNDVAGISKVKKRLDYGSVLMPNLTVQKKLQEQLNEEAKLMEGLPTNGIKNQGSFKNINTTVN